MVIPEIPPFHRPAPVKAEPIALESTADVAVPQVKGEDGKASSVDQSAGASAAVSPAAASAKLNPGASTFVFKPNPKAADFKPVSKGGLWRGKESRGLTLPWLGFRRSERPSMRRVLRHL